MASCKELLNLITSVYYIAVSRHANIKIFCNDRWIKNLKSLPEEVLFKKLRFIIDLCSMRTVLYIYKRGIFNRFNKKSIDILARYLISRNLHETPFAADIMRQHNVYKGMLLNF